MKTVPDCIYVSVAIHVTSPSTGLNAAITVGGRAQFDLSECDWPELIKHSCDTLNAACDVDDARPMTKEEVKEYRTDEESDASEVVEVE